MISGVKNAKKKVVFSIFSTFDENALSWLSFQIKKKKKSCFDFSIYIYIYKHNTIPLFLVVLNLGLIFYYFILF